MAAATHSSPAGRSAGGAHARTDVRAFASTRTLSREEMLGAALRWPRPARLAAPLELSARRDRKSTRLNSSHSQISYAVFCLKKTKHRLEQVSRRAPAVLRGCGRARDHVRGRDVTQGAYHAASLRDGPVGVGALRRHSPCVAC